MTTRIGVRELRQHASRYIKRAHKGERIEITDRGKLTAVLISPSPEEQIYEDLLSSGALIPGTGNLASWSPLPGDPSAKPPSAVLQRMRDAERDWPPAS